MVLMLIGADQLVIDRQSLAADFCQVSEIALRSLNITLRSA
mgnify:CR=1 FL=1